MRYVILALALIFINSQSAEAYVPPETKPPAETRGAGSR